MAKVTGLREGAVRVRLHRARLMLRRELSHAGKRVKHGQTMTIEKTKPKRCRGLFAELSDYLDGVVDEEICERMKILSE